MTKTQLRREVKTATAMLKGKTVRAIWRHRASEVGIEFSDGTRMFVDQTPSAASLWIARESIEPLCADLVCKLTGPAAST